MPRPDKVQAVADIKDRIDQAKAVFIAEYAGLSVQDQQTLRRGLKSKGAEFKVVKMTLARRASAHLDIESLEALLIGPTGLAFADEDAVNAAKTLRDFARDHDVFIIKGGLLGTDFLTPERINDLADIESRDVLLAKLAGAIQAPLAKVAGLLQALPRGLATAMQQLIDKLPASPDAAPADDSTEPEVADGAPDAEVGVDAADGAAADDATEPEVADEAAEPEVADEAPDAVAADGATEPEAADDAPDAVAAADQADDAPAADAEVTDEDDTDDTDDDEPAASAEEE